MQFRTLTDAHIDKCRPYFELLSHTACDYTLGGVFMWRGMYNTEFYMDEHCLIVRLYEDEIIYYCLPMCKDQYILTALKRLAEYEKEQGNNLFRLCAVPTEYIPLFDELGLKYTLSAQPDFYDYVYSAEDLINLSGKKYGGQRNLIRQFNRIYEDNRLEEITPDNIGEVKEFFNANFEAAAEGGNKTAENALVNDVLDKALFGMQGAVLYTGGKVAGFSVGEQVGDTLYVHIEKADRNVKGAYQTLNNRFAAKYGKNAVYINREDDMGDEGLRKAKLAYHPVKLLEKFEVEFEL